MSLPLPTPDSSKGPEEKKLKPHSQVLQPSATPFAPKNLGNSPLSIPSKQHPASLVSYFNSTETPNVQKIVYYYKTTQCPEYNATGMCSKGENCFYYHTIDDARRPPFIADQLAYSSEFCHILLSGNICPNGNACYYSHNRLESLYHPHVYKTSYCPESCNKPYCPFYHTSSELRKAETLLLYTFQIQNPQQQHQIIDPYFSLPINDQISPFLSPILPQSLQIVSLKPLTFDLDNFKTKPCTYPHIHNQKRCIYYHSASDRRRVPVTYSYERCPMSKHSYCPLEDTCKKAHSTVEQLYHPEKYKKKMCKDYPNKIKDCEFGEFCCFAHTEPELNIERIHEYEKDMDFYMFYFKTERCPFNHEHNKSICVYAHNWQDFRRKPTAPFPQYAAMLCTAWAPESFIYEYHEGCPRGFKCQCCHGWKEYLFHPFSYKTQPCQDIGKCRMGPDCPFYHGAYDRRSPNTQSGIYMRHRQILGPQTIIPMDSMIQSFETELRISEGFSSTSDIGSGGYLSESETNLVINSPQLSQENIAIPLAQNNIPTEKCSPLDKTNKSASTQEKIPVKGEASLNEFYNMKYSPENVSKTLELSKLIDDKKSNRSSLITTEEEKKRLTLDSEISGKQTSPGTKTEDSNNENSSKSCPTSPEVLKNNNKYGKILFLKSLRSQDPEDDDETKSKTRLKNMFNSIGLSDVAEKLLDAGYGYYDLLVDPEIKCKSIGIIDPVKLEKIIQKVQAILSRPAGADSPGIFRKNNVKKVVMGEDTEEESPNKMENSTSLRTACEYFKK